MTIVHTLLIDPLVDCVFKALLADPANQDLLLDFLHGVLRPAVPIVSLHIQNPYNPAEFVGGKETVVDVKATDQSGAVYQIELQVRIGSTLPQRILYTWAHVYQGQLAEGEPYSKLRPACAIWILEGVLFRDTPAFHHRFAVVDPQTQRRLSPQLDIHVLELRKLANRDLHDPAAPLDARERWMYFLREAGRWPTLPPALRSPEMEKAMSILHRFGDAQRDLALYQSRMDALRLQRTQELEDEEAAAELAAVKAALALAEAEREQVRAETERLRTEKEHLRAEKERLRTEKERLRAKLIAAGLDPADEPA